MFAKIVVIERKDLEFHSNLKNKDVGGFGVYSQGDIIVCRSLSHCYHVIRGIEL